MLLELEKSLMDGTLAFVEWTILQTPNLQGLRTPIKQKFCGRFILFESQSYLLVSKRFRYP
jgi:hypothetical protein